MRSRSYPIDTFALSQTLTLTPDDASWGCGIDGDGFFVEKSKEVKESFEMDSEKSKEVKRKTKLKAWDSKSLKPKKKKTKDLKKYKQILFL